MSVCRSGVGKSPALLPATCEYTEVISRQEPPPGSKAPPGEMEALGLYTRIARIDQALRLAWWSSG